jgi:hypothetical protein
MIQLFERLLILSQHFFSSIVHIWIDQLGVLGIFQFDTTIPEPVESLKKRERHVSTADKQQWKMKKYEQQYASLPIQ